MTGASPVATRCEPERERGERAILRAVSGAAVRLVIVRHGQVEANVDRRYLGLRDDPLTPLGLEQARAVGTMLRGVPLAAVYSSPLRRAFATASEIAAVQALEVIADGRLREMAFGDWEGMSRAELASRSAGDAGRLARWEDDPTRPPPGGESLELVQRRVLDLVDELARQRAGSAVALVSHVGPIKALVCSLLGMPLAASRRVYVDPASVSVVDWGTAPVLRLFNSHAHLGWENARWVKEGCG